MNKGLRVMIRKAILTAIMFMATMTMNAQKFALVDMDYIFKNIPAYERANEQLSQVSRKWQAEVDALSTEAQTMYKNCSSLCHSSKRATNGYSTWGRTWWERCDLIFQNGK